MWAGTGSAVLFAGLLCAPASAATTAAVSTSQDNTSVQGHSAEMSARSDVLLFEVDFGQATLIDAIKAYGDPADPLLPIGELTRTLELDFAITGVGVGSGRIGASRRPLTLDTNQHFAALAANRITLAEGDVYATPTEIYLRASTLQKLLPIRLTIDSDAMSIALSGTEPLPFELRSSRLAHRALVGEIDSNLPDSLAIASPYAWLGAPAFDIGMALGSDNARGGFTRRFEGRVAADVLKTSFSGYVGTDDSGRPSSALVRLERRDAAGSLLGPLHATYVAAGDVYAPALAIGARSVGGTGVVISTARIAETSVFQRITLRGELPLGYDIELYVNEVLRGAQDKSVQGRYEFVDVPLVRGRNVIRVVTFGPHGERSEQTRVINAGGGQVAAGQLSLDAGFVLQDRPVFTLDRQAILPPSGRKGNPRGVIQLAYGLTPTVTLIGGYVHYSDDFGQVRNTATTGLRTSLLGVAVQADYARDFGRGSSYALGLAGSVGPISYFARNNEYSGDFNDETNALVEITRPLRRSTEAQIDSVVHLFSRNAIPVSLRGLRAEYLNGDATLYVQGRTTVSLFDTLFAVGSDYRSDDAGSSTTRTWTGDLAATRRLDNWQLRAAANLDLQRRFDLRSLAMTADRPLSERFGLRLGLGKSFGIVRDLTAQAGVSAQLPFADANFSGAYSTEQKRWQIGIQLNFGLAFDPFARRYRMTRPGPAGGASAALLAFVDADADGRAGADERRLEGIKITGIGSNVVTDAKGEAFVTGLGSNPTGAFRVDSSSLDDVFLTSPPQDVSFAPRPGQVLRVPYPFTPTSEVVIRLQIEQPDGTRVGLSSLRFVLVTPDGGLVDGSTEFDGTAVLENVRPGRYELRLDPEQSRRLGMRLAKSVTVSVNSESGQVSASGIIIFEGDKP
ncbi:hypothetical protein ACOYW6_07770 [Parablastomonas sp. CN1-191]|uniref:hypothetical protein n=1 Tax=Parablastomonas sp. CN1-191 TaxID=3400908 RepID=UPI003BF84A6D